MCDVGHDVCGMRHVAWGMGVCGLSCVAWGVAWGMGSETGPLYRTSELVCVECGMGHAACGTWDMICVKYIEKKKNVCI